MLELGPVQLAQIVLESKYHTNGFISKLDVYRIGICFRVNGNGLDAQLSSGSHNSAGDLSSVCNQDLIKILPTSEPTTYIHWLTFIVALLVWKFLEKGFCCT
jgi:hypothetical protein